MIEISTRVLRAMVALDDLRHFSQAAERCHVTQSALSQMIGKLEHIIDLRLIDRDRRRVSLTPEGERFVATARRVLLELEEISQDLKDHSSMRKGRVSISALPSFASHWLPPVIRDFRAAYPNIQVFLNDANPDRSLEQVRQRQADFAITAAGPGVVGFGHRLLFEEPFVLVCHKDHKLAKLKQLNLEELAGQDFIRLAYWGNVGHHLQAFLARVQVHDSGLEVAQLSTAAGLVKYNLGVSLVPRSALPYFDKDVVVSIPLPEAELAMPVYLVWRAASTLSPAAAKFIEMLPAQESQPRTSAPATTAAPAKTRKRAARA